MIVIEPTSKPQASELATTRARQAHRASFALLALLLAASFGAVACQPASSTSAGTTAVAAARAQIGKPYVYGGESPAEGGFDCSGLTYYAWGRARVALPRTASAQYTATARLSKAQLLPGDFVFYSAGGPHGTVSHMAIYSGNGKIIQARKPGVPVQEVVMDTYWNTNLVGYGRVRR